MTNNIENHINEINRLMKYDRSKTLLEQSITDDNDYDLTNIYNQPQTGYQDRFANNRYNPIQNDIDKLGIDNWTRMQNKTEAMKYKEDKKPTEPTVARGEGYYLDGNGSQKNPNGYWYITYDSPRYKKYYTEIIKPMLDLNKRDPETPMGKAGMPPFLLLSGKYKEEVWDIYKKDLEEWEDRQPSPLEFLKEWDAHDWLETAELITGLIGMIPIPPVALAGNLLSMGFGVANSGLYAYEGNTYDASIALAFALIPGPETVRLTRELRKPGKTVVRQGVTQLTDEGVKLIDDAVRANWRKALSASLKSVYEKYGIDYTMRYLLYIYKELPSIAKIYITIAGLPLTIEQLYYLWTLTLTPEEKLREEEKVAMSNLKPVMDMLRRPDLWIWDLFKYITNNMDENDFSIIDNVDEEMFKDIKPEMTEEEENEFLQSLIKK